MIVTPANKRILVEELGETPQEVETRAFILPEETKQPSEYMRVVVRAIAQDVEMPSDLEPGHEVVVPSHLIETVVVGNEEFKLVPSNYVMCIIARN